MPAYDQCHDQVIRALQKDGWLVVRSPAPLYTAFRNVFIDAQLTKGTNGQSQQIMLVEIKCFPDESSTTRDLYVAVGQYLIYRAMIRELELGESLYLAVPDVMFDRIFDSAVMSVIDESHIRLVIIDLVSERVVRWIR